MPVVSTTKMTADQFLQLGADPTGVRLELVEGEVAVSPSPTPEHSNVVVQLIILLGNHVYPNDLGELYESVDTILDHFTVRRPDVLYFSRDRTHLVGEKAMEGPPDLAIEVISPSSVEIDREDKFKQYAEAGVAYYWIVDPNLMTMEGWQLRDGAYIGIGQAQGGASIKLLPFPDLEIPLSRLWRRSRSSRN